MQSELWLHIEWVRDVMRRWIVTSWSLMRWVVLIRAYDCLRDCVGVVEMLPVRVWGIPKMFVW